MTTQRISLEAMLSQLPRGPISILMGAGCSVTAGIPTADVIASTIRQSPDFQKRVKAGEATDYYEVMGCLAPLERRDIFSSYIARSQVNVSSLIAARLLEQGIIGCILTPNFDNLIPRAVATSIASLPIYDATLTTLQDGFDVYRPSVICLHGQMHGFWQLNTRSEFDTYHATIRRLLRGANRDHDVIVVGYSGVDPLLPILFEELAQTSAVYWVPFRRVLPVPAALSALDRHARSYLVEDDLDSDHFFYHLGRHFRALQRYNTRWFRETLDKLSVIRSELPLHEGTVDILSDSKEKIARAKDLYEDPAISVTHAVTDVDRRIPLHEARAAVAALEKGLNGILLEQTALSAEALFDVAVQFQAAGRLSLSESSILSGIGWAERALARVPDHDVQLMRAIHLFLAIALSEVGRMTKNAAPLIRAEPHYVRAVELATDEATLVGTKHSYATSRADLAKLALAENPPQTARARSLYGESRKLFEETIVLASVTAKAMNNYSSMLLDMSHLPGNDECLDVAQRAAEQAEAMQYGAGAYNVACAAALQGRVDDALHWLGRAMKTRKHRPEQVEQDADFLDLRGDPRFEELMKQHRS